MHRRRHSTVIGAVASAAVLRLPPLPCQSLMEAARPTDPDRPAARRSLGRLGRSPISDPAGNASLDPQGLEGTAAAAASAAAAAAPAAAAPAVSTINERFLCVAPASCEAETHFLRFWYRHHCTLRIVSELR